MLRDFVIRNLALAPLADLGFSSFDAGAQANPCDHNFAESLVGDSNHLHFADFGIGVEELFDFAGINVFAAANDDVAGAAGDVQARVGA